jgi:hypothetical protein
VLATRGDVVFAATTEGNLIGLDAHTAGPCGTFRRADRSWGHR